MSKLHAEVKGATIRFLPESDEDRRWGPPVAGFLGLGRAERLPQSPPKGKIIDLICWPLAWLPSGSGLEKGSFYRSKLNCSSKLIQLFSSVKFENLYQFFFFFFSFFHPSRRLRRLELMGCWFRAMAARRTINTRTTKLNPGNGRWSLLIGRGEIHRRLKPFLPWAKRKSPSTASGIFLMCNPNIIKVWRLKMGNSYHSFNSQSKQKRAQ